MTKDDSHFSALTLRSVSAENASHSSPRPVQYDCPAGLFRLTYPRARRASAASSDVYRINKSRSGCGWNNLGAAVPRNFGTLERFEGAH
ncbi:hypothetical protein EVAR_84006_1 [Eumeta japonica]|uniref:Uncharacterized protein n=1 Tax=Eumeta variegata TaxID=151549 RepID=A0A4C1X4Z4_EUMVA|nr:hypothetical protein EVAR_84006_1 [Eumeta japonica]